MLPSGSSIVAMRTPFVASRIAAISSPRDRSAWMCSSRSDAATLKYERPDRSPSTNTWTHPVSASRPSADWAWVYWWVSLEQSLMPSDGNGEITDRNDGEHVVDGRGAGLPVDAACYSHHPALGSNAPWSGSAVRGFHCTLQYCARRMHPIEHADTKQGPEPSESKPRQFHWCDRRHGATGASEATCSVDTHRVVHWPGHNRTAQLGDIFHQRPQRRSVASTAGPPGGDDLGWGSSHNSDPVGLGG